MAQMVQHMPDAAPDKSKPYCLMNADGTPADWFATHAAAVQAMNQTSKASRMYSEEDERYFSLTPVEFEFADGEDGVWIDALQAKDYHTSAYGVVKVTPDKLNNLAASVKKNVRGIQLSTDYEHGTDSAKGKKASGTINDARVTDNTLQLNVSWTDTAKKEIKDGEWKYFSSDWMDEYIHEDGTKHVDVLLGGGLTNRPVAKSLNPLPINFSEVFEENKQFAKLSYQQRKNLPASKFLYIAPDGTKHLPVPDEAHIRNAISRLSQPATGRVAGESWLTESLRASLLAKARRMLKGKSMSEENMNELLKRLATELGISFSEDEVDENELGEKVFTELHKLNEEIQPIRDLKNHSDKEKTFAEQFPEEYKQMLLDRQFRLETNSNQFAETIGSRRFTEHKGGKDAEGKDVMVSTTRGLSGLALDKIRETHLKFAEGNVTVEDFTGTIDAIMNNGIVDYGEVGSTQGETQNGHTDAVPAGASVLQIRNAFAEKVNEVHEELQSKPENKDKVVPYQMAFAETVTRYPKLHEAYLGARSAA